MFPFWCKECCDCCEQFVYFSVLRKKIFDGVDFNYSLEYGIITSDVLLKITRVDEPSTIPSHLDITLFTSLPEDVTPSLYCDPFNIFVILEDWETIVIENMPIGVTYS